MKKIMGEAGSGGVEPGRRQDGVREEATGAEASRGEGEGRQVIDEMLT